MSRSRYCALIPAFQAEETIGEVVSRVKAQGLDVVVVDDGSRDRTAAAAATHGALVISHLRNRGKGSALRTGFAYALRERYDGVVVLDSDGQHDPAEIPRLIEAGERQHAGLVVGNRMADGLPAAPPARPERSTTGGGAAQGGVAMPPTRRWVNAAMSTIISQLIRQRIPDSQCGFRVIRKELLADVPLTAARFEIESEVLLSAARRRWKIISVPVTSIYRDQASHIRPLLDTLRFLRLVARFLLWRR